MPPRQTVKARAKAKPKAKKPISMITLPARNALGEASKLKADLDRAISSRVPVTIDAGAVTRIDAATLQLLVAFVRERQSEARGVRWQGTPVVLERAARQLGLASALQFGGAESA